MPVSAPVVIADDSLIEITTTFDDREAAAACGRSLIEAGLAACVQVDGPVTSLYRWQGALETAEEWRCTCKTLPAARDACVAAILAGHPYDTPQLVIASVGATSNYAAWARQQVESP
jgi:periplasmic divalent cation tolerance protein